MKQWQKEGWRPRGPGACGCPSCGATVSTNALARSRHRCPEPEPAPSKKIADHIDGYDRDDTGESPD